LDRVCAYRDEWFVADFIARCVIVILALSPLLRRLYIERFWIAERGKGSTLIQARGRVGVDAVVEYHAAGQRLSSRFSYWQRFNENRNMRWETRLKFSITHETRRVLSSIVGDGWIGYIVITILFASALFSATAPRSPGP
jgi:hypothetical protein